MSRDSRLWQDSQAHGTIFEGDVAECTKWLGIAKARLRFMLQSTPGATSVTWQPEQDVEIRVDTRPNQISIKVGGVNEYITFVDIGGTVSTYPNWSLPPHQIKNSRYFIASSTKGYKNSKSFFGGTMRNASSPNSEIGTSGWFGWTWTNRKNASLSYFFRSIYINGKFCNLQTIFNKLLSDNGWYDITVHYGTILPIYGDHTGDAVVVLVISWSKPAGAGIGQYLLRLDVSYIYADGPVFGATVNQDPTDAAMFAGSGATTQENYQSYYNCTQLTETTRKVAWFTLVNNTQKIIVRTYDALFKTYVDEEVYSGTANSYTIGESCSFTQADDTILAIKVEGNKFSLLTEKITECSGGGTETTTVGVQTTTKSHSYSYTLKTTKSISSLTPDGVITPVMERFGGYASSHSSSGYTERYISTGDIKDQSIDKSSDVSIDVVIGYCAEKPLAVIQHNSTRKVSHDEESYQNDTVTGTTSDEYFYAYFEGGASPIKTVAYYTPAESELNIFSGTSAPITIPSWPSTGNKAPSFKNINNVTLVGRKLAVTSYYDPLAPDDRYPFRAIVIDLTKPQTFAEIGAYLGADDAQAYYTPLAFSHNVVGQGTIEEVTF